MRKIYTRGIAGIIIFMVLMVTASFGQFGSPTNCSSPGSCNLVANPSFESSIACPSASNSQVSLACNWVGYSTGESYYYSTCANSSYPNRGLPKNEHNCSGVPSGNSARTGNAAIGMIEYVGGLPYNIMYSGKIYQQLSANLVNGKKYYVEMYASPSQCYATAMKEIGILFTASNPTSLNVNTMTPQVESPSLLGLGWNRVGGCFTANGTERFISIGCFRERTTQVTRGSIGSATSGGAAFYYFDDVLLIELPTAGSNRNIACNASTTLGISCGTTALPFTYSWTSSPADPSLAGQTTILNPVVSPIVTTTYTLTVTTPNGCSNVSSVTVSASNGGYTATASATPTTVVCGNTSTLNVTGVPAGSTYSWTAIPSDATLVSTTQSPVVRPTRNTTYNVTVILPNTCKAISNNVSVAVTPISVTAKASSVLICSAGQQTQLGVNGAPPGSTFLWLADPADPSLNASNNTLENPFVSPTVNTRYKLRLTSPYGCTANGEVNVKVSTYSLAVAASPSTISCGGESILTASGVPAGTTYSWSGGDLSATSNPVLVAPLQTTAYTVTATLTNGCVLTANPTVTVNSTLPTPVITGPTEVCPASPIELCTNYTPPCPELGYGDAAIIGYEKSASPANRKINLLLLRDLPSCVTLYITNRQWNGTAFTGNGSTITWNSPGVTAGQILSITGSLVTFNPGDESIYVYQNTSGGIRLLHGLGFSGITPNGLINGLTATVLSNTPTNSGLTLVGSSGLTQQALFNRLLSASNWTTNSIVGNTAVTIVGRPVTGLSWNTGAVTNCIAVSSGGTYAVTYKDIHGCTVSASQSVSTIACCPAPLTATCTGNTYSYADNFQVFYGQGMAIGTNDSIYVSNSSTYAIDVFTSSKTFVRSIPGLSLPIGIDVDNTGNIFVANHIDRSIAKISPAGAIVATWPVLNTIGEAMYPIHVTTDHCGNVYATVTHGYWVTQFDNNGNFIRNIDTRLAGEPTNLTQNLTGVAVDGLFNLFVADNVNLKIKKFDANGNYVTHWTITQNVYELAVDKGGNVYTTELYGGISKYSNSGTLLANFTVGSGWGAVGVDVDSHCNVWTSENNYVRKFDYTSTLPRIGSFNEAKESSAFVRAYPNPSSAGITVDFETEATYDIVICNSVGVEVFRNTMKGKSFEIADDVLSPGLYTIHVSGNGFNSKMIKVVKQ